MSTPVTPSTTSAQSSTFRRICSWCHRDLGALWRGSQQHSYGICDDCKHRHFAHLYARDADSASKTNG